MLGGLAVTVSGATSPPPPSGASVATAESPASVRPFPRPPPPHARTASAATMPSANLMASRASDAETTVNVGGSPPTPRPTTGTPARIAASAVRRRHSRSRSPKSFARVDRRGVGSRVDSRRGVGGRVDGGCSVGGRVDTRRGVEGPRVGAARRWAPRRSCRRPRPAPHPFRRRHVHPPPAPPGGRGSLAAGEHPAHARSIVGLQRPLLDLAGLAEGTWSSRAPTRMRWRNRGPGRPRCRSGCVPPPEDAGMVEPEQVAHFVGQGVLEIVVARRDRDAPPQIGPVDGRR